MTEKSEKIQREVLTLYMPVNTGYELPCGFEFIETFISESTCYTNGSISNHCKTPYALFIKKSDPLEVETENTELRERIRKLENDAYRASQDLKESNHAKEIEIRKLTEQAEEWEQRARKSWAEEKEAKKNAELREKDIFAVRDYLGSARFNEIIGAENKPKGVS